MLRFAQDGNTHKRNCPTRKKEESILIFQSAFGLHNPFLVVILEELRNQEKQHQLQEINSVSLLLLFVVSGCGEECASFLPFQESHTHTHTLSSSTPQFTTEEQMIEKGLEYCTSSQRTLLRSCHNLESFQTKVAKTDCLSLSLSLSLFGCCVVGVVVDVDWLGNFGCGCCWMLSIDFLSLLSDSLPFSLQASIEHGEQHAHFFTLLFDCCRREIHGRTNVATELAARLFALCGAHDFIVQTKETGSADRTPFYV